MQKMTHQSTDASASTVLSWIGMSLPMKTSQSGLGILIFRVNVKGARLIIGLLTALARVALMLVEHWTSYPQLVLPRRCHLYQRIPIFHQIERQNRFSKSFKV
jgi:hypothetical protein